MTVAGLIVRFALIYVAMLAGIVVGATVLGSEGGGAISVVVLIGSVHVAVVWFCRRNRRALDDDERRRVVLAMWGIVLALQLAMSAGVLSATGVSLSAGTIAAIAGAVVVIYGAAIYFTVRFTNRGQEKQFEKAKQAVIE